MLLCAVRVHIQGVGALLVLEDVVLLNHEVVEQIDLEIRLGEDVVLDEDKPVDLDVNRHATRAKLSRQLLVDFHEHVVAGLSYALLAFFLADAVNDTKLVKLDLLI